MFHQPDPEVPEKKSAHVSGKRRRDASDNGYYDLDPTAAKQKKTSLSEEEKERILQMVENEPEVWKFYTYLSSHFSQIHVLSTSSGHLDLKICAKVGIFD